MQLVGIIQVNTETTKCKTTRWKSSTSNNYRRNTTHIVEHLQNPMNSMKCFTTRDKSSKFMNVNEIWPKSTNMNNFQRTSYIKSGIPEQKRHPKLIPNHLRTYGIPSTGPQQQIQTKVNEIKFNRSNLIKID